MIMVIFGCGSIFFKERYVIEFWPFGGLARVLVVKLAPKRF